jgi:polysaccharide pyruvyl transferase WcaK-like protein
VQVVRYGQDPIAFARSIAGCSHFVAVRFHAAVLCLALGIPFVPILYANKTANLLDDVGYTGPRYFTDNLSALNGEQLADELERPDRAFALGCRERQALAEASDGHFLALRRVLEAPAAMGCRLGKPAASDIRPL